jgi:molecular chaperone DnaJ
VNDIKRAFRKLARRYHPDINPGDRAAEERFKTITEAYEVLSDPFKRAFYDRNGFYTEGVLDPPASRGSSQGFRGFSFQGFDFSRPAQSSSSDLFTQFFSRAVERQPERGRDLEYPVAIGFSESMNGLKTRISIQRRHTCTTCDGAGRLAASVDAECEVCRGTGTVVRGTGRLKFSASCPECGGAGRTMMECLECGGEGRVQRTDIIDAEIPAGVSAGSRVRMPGGGDAGRWGGPPGDLFLITNVASHPFFKRVGDNIQCIAPITFAEAALGSKIDIPTIDGSATMRIPPGTQSGQVFRLRHKGAPSLMQPGMRGDQFVEVRVVVPRIADERSKEILKEFARLNADDPRKGIS